MLMLQCAAHMGCNRWYRLERVNCGSSCNDYRWPNGITGLSHHSAAHRLRSVGCATVMPWTACPLPLPAAHPGRSLKLLSCPEMMIVIVLPIPICSPFLPLTDRFLDLLHQQSGKLLAGWNAISNNLTDVSSTLIGNLNGRWQDPVHHDDSVTEQIALVQKKKYGSILKIYGPPIRYL